jgi:hypothetical protein
MLMNEDKQQRIAFQQSADRGERSGSHSGCIIPGIHYRGNRLNPRAGLNAKGRNKLPVLAANHANINS